MSHVNLHIIVDRRAKIIWSWENLIRNAILKRFHIEIFWLQGIVEILSETLEGVDVKFMGVWRFQKHWNTVYSFRNTVSLVAVMKRMTKETERKIVFYLIHKRKWRNHRRNVHNLAQFRVCLRDNDVQKMQMAIL